MQENTSNNYLIRQCQKCDKNMYLQSDIKDSNSKIPWSDKQSLFKCKTCNHEVIITNKSSILSNIVSGISILIGLCYLLFTGLFEFILYSFTQSLFSILGGVVLIVLVVLFLLGSLSNIINGFQQIQTNSIYPIVNNEMNNTKTNKQMKLSLFLGILPIIFSLLLGMIDFYWYEINDVAMMFLLPIIFSPIIFANKLKSSIINVFYGTLFWFVLGLAGFYFFG